MAAGAPERQKYLNTTVELGRVSTGLDPYHLGTM